MRSKAGPYGNPFARKNRVPIQKKIDIPAPPGSDLPRMNNYVADYGGCGHYRVLWPEQVMNGLGLTISSSNTGLVGDPSWYTNMKALQIQRQASTEHLNFVHFLKQAQQQHGFKLIYNIDDAQNLSSINEVEVPKSKHVKEHLIPQAPVHICMYVCMYVKFP
jgi:hypothetical protein